MGKTITRKIASNPAYLGLIVLGFLLLLFVLSLAFRGKKDNEAQISEGQIQIIKGDEIITINQNGLVEYKSKDRSYSETWDTSQINSFFSMMERKAKDYMAKRVSGGDCGYRVFMFIDKKLVSICLDSSDEDMAENVEPIFIKYSDVNLSDYFDDGDDSGDNDDEGEFDGVINFPTSTTQPVRATPTPTPYSGGTNTNYAPIQAGCENWSSEIVNNSAIISNTYCTADATPTPTP